MMEIELPPPAKTGRPSQLTQERLSLVLDVLIYGGSQKSAAEAAGVTPRTIQHWQKIPCVAQAVQQARQRYLKRTSPSYQQWLQRQELIEALEALEKDEESEKTDVLQSDGGCFKQGKVD